RTIHYSWSHRRWFNIKAVSRSDRAEEVSMESATQAAPVSKKMLWAGIIISALPSILFIVSGVFPFINPAAAQAGMAHMGYPASAGIVIAVLEIGCAIIYMIPQTAVLGA